ncbi:MAG: hypothetical protein ACREUU_10170, partial [Gammaproteobacteria bacterium]
MNLKVALLARARSITQVVLAFAPGDRFDPAVRATTSRPGHRGWLAGVLGVLLVLGGLASHGQTVLIDFGAGATPTLLGPAPNDPAHHWNNLLIEVGALDTGVLTNLVTTLNMPTSIGLMMVSRFSGFNESGTTVSTLYPPNATRDSFFGHTELFGGLSNIFPSFKLTGLGLDTVYSFTFYASRTGVADVRETGYTVTGGNAGFAALDAANNIDNFATVAGIMP